MSALDTLIYGIRWIYNAGSALTQRTKINLVAPLFATDDIPNARTNIGLAAGLSVVPTPTAPSNQVLQNTGTAMAWQPYTEYGAAPAAAGTIRLTDGNTIESAGTVELEAATDLTLTAGDDLHISVVDDMTLGVPGTISAPSGVDLDVTGALAMDATTTARLAGATNVTVESTGATLLLKASALVDEYIGGSTVGNIAAAKRQIGPEDGNYTLALPQDGYNSAVRAVTIRGADNAASHGTDIILRPGDGSSDANAGRLYLKDNNSQAAITIEHEYMRIIGHGAVETSTSTAVNPYTVLATDREILYGGTGTVTLPAAPERDRVLFVFCCDDGTGFVTTVNGNGKNINRAATLVLAAHEGARLKYDGTEWWAYLTA